MYADFVTPSMEKAITETHRRRTIQQQYNEQNGIVPKTIKKDVRDILEISSKEKKSSEKEFARLPKREREQIISRLEKEMRAAAKMLEFEQAAYLRDKIAKLKGEK
jgi:excinuclease ABC subunit B